jgi:hypothetical protein
MSKVYRGPSMDASYHVSVHLTKWFHRRSFFKSSNQKQELPVMAMFVNGSGQNEQSLLRTFHMPQAILVSDWLISENLL